MEASDLIEFCPRLYHVTAPENWEPILHRGLLPVSGLLELFEDDDGERDRRERQHRSAFETLENPASGRAILRDQKSLRESMLRRCLLDGLRPEDWYQILNQRVFFWPNCDRVRAFLKPRHYQAMRHLLIVVRTDRLIADYSDVIELSPINSGATRSVDHKRGRSTFKALSDYDFDGWRKKRRSRKRAVAEVVVRGAVEKLTRIATSAIRLDPNGTQEVIWRGRDH
ncbi:MAG: hypothetical protein F4Z90_11890 [Acidimicrobiaceae bacterium]|nr:hypothetical protein [Acidimicrobiaceae bacterium]